MMKLDTDSHLVGIDNRCSACIIHDINDFAGPMYATRKIITGYGVVRDGKLKNGTIRWVIEDDDGKRHTLLIPNSYYSP